MAATEEGTDMRRKKRFTIRLVALGFAVAAIGAPAAQAIPEGVHGSDLRVLHGDSGVVSPDDRVIHGTSPQIVKSPDDRPVHGVSMQQASQPVAAQDASRFELSNGALTGIVLGLLAAVLAAYTVHQVRKAGKLASV